jgi:hypothetical protein
LLLVCHVLELSHINQPLQVGQEILHC